MGKAIQPTGTTVDTDAAFVASILDDAPTIASSSEAAQAVALTEAALLSMAEGRIEDAMAIIGQQLALSRHLGQDEFLVSNLVGIAIAGIAWNDLLYLVQHPECPNLYWALSVLPRPLVDTRHAMSVERQFLYQQLERSVERAANELLQVLGPKEYEGPYSVIGPPSDDDKGKSKKKKKKGKGATKSKAAAKKK